VDAATTLQIMKKWRISNEKSVTLPQDANSGQKFPFNAEVYNGNA
jgi:hypothetical protein